MSGKQRPGYRLEKRMAALGALGGKCARCGFDDWRALQVDHVTGGGTKERRTRGTITYFLTVVVEAKSGKYQVLCANCNWIKRFENKEHWKY